MGKRTQYRTVNKTNMSIGQLIIVMLTARNTYLTIGLQVIRP